MHAVTLVCFTFWMLHFYVYICSHVYVYILTGVFMYGFRSSLLWRCIVRCHFGSGSGPGVPSSRSSRLTHPELNKLGAIMTVSGRGLKLFCGVDCPGGAPMSLRGCSRGLWGAPGAARWPPRGSGGVLFYRLFPCVSCGRNSYNYGHIKWGF